MLNGQKNFGSAVRQKRQQAAGKQNNPDVSPKISPTKELPRVPSSILPQTHSPTKQTELRRRRQYLLREKVTLAELLSKLRQEKTTLLNTNHRLLQQETHTINRLKQIQKEQLSLYRRYELEKQTLLQKLHLLQQMQASNKEDSKIAQVEQQLQKVKQLFYQQESLNKKRYEEMVSEAEQLQQTNRRLRQYIEDRRV